MGYRLVPHDVVDVVQQLPSRPLSGPQLCLHGLQAGLHFGSLGLQFGDELIQSPPSPSAPDGRALTVRAVRHARSLPADLQVELAADVARNTDRP